MAATKYAYSIQTDFPNHVVASDRLVQEIRLSSIVTALDCVNTTGDVCDIWFKDTLSAGDESVLTGVVAVHSGTPLPSTAQEVTLAGVPVDDDGKPQMVPNLLPHWTSLCFTGQGDHRTNGLGAGAAFTCASEASGDSVVEWIYIDQIFLVGGMALFSGAELGDTLDYYVVAPATPTGSGTTNVTKVTYGPGNVLVPNPAGADVINLADCAIVPSPGVGYWDWDAPSQGWGTITPNYAGTGGYSLFDFEVPLGHPLVGLHILGSGKLDFLMSNITPMKVQPHWLHRAVVHNSGHAGLKLAWMFVGGRGGAI
jgi:hypothetical protein